MPRWLALTLLATVIVAFVGSVWFFSFHARASEAQVTRLAYAKFGRSGAPIRCIPQAHNHAVFYCTSPRFGDDPFCIRAAVDVFGNITMADRPTGCEGG
jgi:hypothetical protein